MVLPTTGFAHRGGIALLRVLCHWCQLLSGEGKLLLVLKDPGSHITVEISLSESTCNCSWFIINDCWKYLVDLEFDFDYLPWSDRIAACMW